MGEEDVETARKELDANEDGLISREEFMDWYKKSLFFEKKKESMKEVADKQENEEEEGISLEFPQSWKGRIFYVITAPIMFSLYFTVPDMRKPKWKPYWPIAFAMSIFWLAVYSFCMVWWATVIGKMAGTSVPDLLTSVIVAKAGNGDMAVSSSIGSNIFDILVGLPLPWFFATAASIQKDQGYNLKIEVSGDGIFISIMILFAMIGAVLTIIYCSKWRMSRTLGYSMFVLYFIFCIQDILRNPDLGWSWTE